MNSSRHFLLEIKVFPVNIFEDCVFQGGNISVIPGTKNFTELDVVSRNKLLSAPPLENGPVNKNRDSYNIRNN